MLGVASWVPSLPSPPLFPFPALPLFLPYVFLPLPSPLSSPLRANIEREITSLQGALHEKGPDRKRKKKAMHALFIRTQQKS